MDKSYDYLVVGCGMFGAVFARAAADAGRRVLVVDQRDHLGGNCYSETIEGVEVHRYGPHIFHTDDKRIWKFVNRFATFNHYVHHGRVRHGNRTYSFPINLMTLAQLWGVNTPAEAEQKLRQVRVVHENPRNLRDWIVSQVGQELYEIFVKGYTIKQWGRDPAELPTSIIRRLPIRMTLDDRYFEDRYQGIPIGGYARLFENMLDHALVDVVLGVNYFDHDAELRATSVKTVYTGKIDEFFDYRFGELEYRSLRFETEVLDGDFQGAAIVNYTDQHVPYTRITEHKHFAFQRSPRTVITREYPQSYERGRIPYYPIRDVAQTARYEQYRALADQSGVLFGGRLATYQYYDMHQVIGQALALAAKETAQDVTTSMHRDVARRAPTEIGSTRRVRQHKASTPRRNLIISPIGDQSVHGSWLSHPLERSFDVFLVYYGRQDGFGRQQADYYAQRLGFKWELLHWVAQEHGPLLDRYANIWLPDDDVRVDTLSINRLFELFERYALQLAQPAIAAGEASYESLRQQEGVILRYSPFVEIMCPLFTRQALARVAHTFLESRSGWGLDWLWARFFEPHEIGIIDAVGVEHTGRLFHGENYARLAKLGVEPAADFQRLIARYGGFERRLHRRLVRGKIKLPEIRDSPVRSGLMRRLVGGLGRSWLKAG